MYIVLLNTTIGAYNLMCTCAQMLQQDQEQEIRHLEEELEERRFQHEDRIRSMKTKFLREKKAFEEATEARIRTMADSANKVSHKIDLFDLKSV